jgi:hypothetical protein
VPLRFRILVVRLVRVRLRRARGRRPDTAVLKTRRFAVELPAASVEPSSRRHHPARAAAKENTMPHRTVTQFSVVVPNEPGELAKVTYLLSQEEVNIEGVLSVNVGDTASIQFVADGGSAVRRRLEAAGLAVLENQVFHIQLPNKPEHLNELARELAADGINILSLYGNVEGDLVKLVLAVDQPESAARVMARLGIAAAGQPR